MLNRVRQRPNAAVAALDHELPALECRGEMNEAGVFFIFGFRDEGLLFQGVNDARHGGRADLFCFGQVAECDGAAEDDDRERGEAGGIEAACIVGSADCPQQVDRGCVKLGGDGFRVGRILR